MGTKENKAVVQRFWDELIFGGNIDVADELLAPDYVNLIVEGIGAAPTGQPNDDGADNIAALMAQVGYATMLIAPVFVSGETLGLMLAFSSRERPWSRVETSRARVIAHQLGPVIGAPAADRVEPLGLDLAATD